jgi:hypothetical protein
LLVSFAIALSLLRRQQPTNRLEVMEPASDLLCTVPCGRSAVVVVVRLEAEQREDALRARSELAGRSLAPEG